MSDRVPGWYPDDDDATQQRYWDGVAWTGDVKPAAPAAPAPSREEAAPEEPSPAPVSTEPASTEPASTGPESTGSRRNLVIGLGVAAVVAVVVVVLATTVLSGGDDDEVSTDATAASDEGTDGGDAADDGEQAEGGDGEDGGGSGEGLTVDDLLAVEVPSSLGCTTGTGGGDTIQLVDGYAECEVTEPFPATHSIWIDGLSPGNSGEPTGAVVGDLTGDGVDDGAILTYANQGQAGNPFPGIWVYGSDGELLGEVLERPDEPDSISIVDGVLELSGADYAETDNNADGPSIPVTVRLAYEGGAMVVVG